MEKTGELKFQFDLIETDLAKILKEKGYGVTKDPTQSYAYIQVPIPAGQKQIEQGEIVTGGHKFYYLENNFLFGKTGNRKEKVGEYTDGELTFLDPETNGRYKKQLDRVKQTEAVLVLLNSKDEDRYVFVAATEVGHTWCIVDTHTNNKMTGEFHEFIVGDGKQTIYGILGSSVNKKLVWSKDTGFCDLPY